MQYGLVWFDPITIRVSGLANEVIPGYSRTHVWVKCMVFCLFMSKVDVNELSPITAGHTRPLMARCRRYNIKEFDPHSFIDIANIGSRLGDTLTIQQDYTPVYFVSPAV